MNEVMYCVIRRLIRQNEKKCLLMRRGKPHGTVMHESGTASGLAVRSSLVCRGVYFVTKYNKAQCP